MVKKERLNGLDLFSGIGGITKALEEYVRPVAYCESDRYAQAVLLSRMATGDTPIAPIWDDVTTLKGKDLPPVEIIYGGFPCQDISVAGRREGLGGKRSGLFFEIVRLAREISPTFIFLENVAGIRTQGGDIVVKELSALRYDCRWGMLSAAEVGANHKRNRWWLLAHTNGQHGFRRPEPQLTDRSSRTTRLEPQGICDAVADSNRNATGGLSIGAQEKNSDSFEPSRIQNTKFNRLEEQRNIGVSGGQTSPITDSNWWSIEPNVGRVAHGIPFRVDRLRGLGNAVVPAQAREAFERLMGL